MTTDPDEILRRVSHLGKGDSSRNIYDDWSASYDEHLLEGFGYISPAVAADTLSELTASTQAEIIDYGCGTGLVGVELAKRGFHTVDGVDVSEGMLGEAASKGVYRSLFLGDLTAPIDLPNERYDAGTCIGSMGAGHVGAHHVPELLRPLKIGAPFIVILNDMYYDTGGFEQAFRTLESDGVWRIRKLEKVNYMAELTRPGWLLAAEKRA